MEVTKRNFEEIFPEIVKEIESATFLCIDGEFTGLSNGYNITAFDTPAESYQKIRAGYLDFLFIQFGLSIFTQDQKTGRYKNKTYVFYLFPRPHNRLAPDARFLCQTSSIDFLVSNDFDFNKLFKEGIPYLNASDESSLSEAMEVKRSYIANQQKDSPSYQAIPVPKTHLPVIESAMKKIEKVVKGIEDEIKVEKCTSFVRKLIYQTFRERYGKCENVILKSDNGGMICKRGVEEQQADQDAKELALAVGFSKLVREISAKGKLVVGHNMLLDICHLIHRFLDPLPADYQLFKEMVHSVFPKLIDTKFICSDDGLKQILNNTTLEGLMETVSKPPFHLPAVDEVDGYSYSETGKYHDAGYDALVTGKIFLALLRALDPDNKKCVIEHSRPLEKFMNKFFLMRAPDTCIDLIHPDPEPSRDHVFHISFPSCWTGSNIFKLFSPFGSVQVHWLSDTTAWVSLHDRELGPKALESLQDRVNLPAGVTVISYHRYMQEKGAATSPRPNKRKSPHIESSHAEKRQRRSSDLRNGSMRRISPIPEESPAKDKSMAKEESEIANLEKAATFEGDFGESSTWD